MKKSIITVSREFGSGGRTIGKTVAQRLGIPYYDKELVKQVALESGFDPKYIEEQGEFALNCTPFVRQYDILTNKWGALLCQKGYQTNVIHQNSRNEWLRPSYKMVSATRK